MNGVAQATCHGSPHTSVLQTRPPQPSLPPPVFSTPRDDTGFYLSLITPDALLANFSKQNLGLFQVVLMQGGRWDPFASEIYGGGDKARPTGWHAGVLPAAAGGGGSSSADPPPHSRCAFSLPGVCHGGGYYIALCWPLQEGSRTFLSSISRTTVQKEDGWLQVASHSLCQHQSEGPETGWCVEKELPLDKNVGLSSLGVRKAAQASGLPETTTVWQM